MADSAISVGSSRRTVITRSACAVLIALLALAGCGRGKEAGEISIGAILPLSGENASFGTTARAAYRIAEQDAAQQGLPKIKVIYGDSKLDKDLALKEFRRLVDAEKVVGFVEVTGSGVALALAPIAAKERIPIVSGIDSSPELTEKEGRFSSGSFLPTRTLGKCCRSGQLDRECVARP